GWKKWDDFTMHFLQPMGDVIIASLQLKPTNNVLDLAAGTGEPGLTIAAIVSKGKVTGSDLSEKMLAIAKDNAAAKGLKNYSTIAADVCELPFADNTFDAVSCRMGFMFFPDMATAAREMTRVLKPGGRLATSVWSAPAKNPWVTSMMGPLNTVMQLPPPPPGAPGMFRCAQPGLIADLFKEAGLKNVAEQEVTGMLDYTSPEQFWTNMMEIAAPVVGAMSKATEEQKTAIKAAVFKLLAEKQSGNQLPLPFASLVISGEK
ncbi:MAG TPA: methyltransferase domain-containing protein, partial [Chitinophagaceae bacterium]